MVTADARGVDALRRAIEPDDRVAGLVADFYDESGPFAGLSFLGFGSNPPHEITAGDLLAVTFMGEFYPPLAVRRLTQSSLAERVAALLADIPTGLAIWDVSTEQLHDEEGAPVQLWRELLSLYLVGRTKVSKLMARKRPALVPVYDRWIGEKIATVDDYWRVYHAFLCDDSNQADVNALRPSHLSEQDLPTLRILDTAVWMRYSEGRAAVAAREKHGL